MAVEIVIMQVPTSKVLWASKTKGWHVGKKIGGKFGINSPYFEKNIAEFTIFES
jgi:hypothetical protein